MDDSQLFSGSIIPNEEIAKLLTGNSDWQITIKGFNPAREPSTGALLTLANGYAGTRDLLKEDHLACRSSTFLAGVFDSILKSPEPPTETGKSPRLICAPDWSNLIIEIDGQPVVLESKRLI